MKFLHTADLHLGKQVGDISLMEDQQFVLDQIIALALEHAVDGVLIAGDIYQKSAPQAEAMAMFDRFVTELSRLCRIFVIGGNHDSQQRVSYFSGLVEDAGVYISRQFEGRMQRITLTDPWGPVDIHLLPFVKPALVRRHLPEYRIVTCQDAVRAALDASGVDKGRRNVLLCHQYVVGAETSESEEMSVGGLDGIEAGLFDDFDYVAMGHIHKPQRMLRDTLRYAGSPLKYSFSEVDHKKGVALVEMEEKGYVSVQRLPLYPLRDMRLVDGLLQEIMEMPYSEDYVWVTIRDELPPPDARVRISTVFPNMLKFSVVNSKTREDRDILAMDRMEKKSVQELFSDFYRQQNHDTAPSPAHMQLLEEILRELEEENA